LVDRLKSEPPSVKASDRLSPEGDGETEGSDLPLATRHSPLLRGSERLSRVVLVDQSILGKTPRSNPAVYIGAFDDIRAVFAQSELAKQRGLNASAFSFNSSQGQCERCRGAGFEKIEMQFLSDIFIRCPDCNGRRYRPHILEVKLRSFSIADLLEATVEQAIAFLSGFPESRPAERAVESLKLLEEVGLGYLRLGQPINTLSGGESQRLKLVRHLAEAIVGADAGKRGTPQPRARKGKDQRSDESPLTPSLSPSDGEKVPFRAGERKAPAPTLFLFDEPTTGLHFDDVRVLLKVFQRLVDAGHSVLVIEHNLEVIKSADWIIDLGPDAGDQGGQVVATGTPEQIAACSESHTGRALRTVLPLPAASAQPYRRSG
jgi:excinuclease ABC subunit A